MTDTKQKPPAPPARGTAGARPGAIRVALGEALAAVEAVRFPLQVAGAEESHSLREDIASQLRDYALPRVEGTSIPLLIVVGGSTGAGKSTLVNSIVGAEISEAGVIRPTTEAPVLVCAPEDEALLSSQAVLAGYERYRSGEPAPESSTALRIVSHDAVPEGLAFIDAPDLDSASDQNRKAARRLLAAADFWLFVTTANRYADAAPWELLRQAAARGTAVAMVLDRVPPQANREVRSHLAQLLADAGHGSAPLFTIPEVELLEQRLPVTAVRPVRTWLLSLGESPEARSRLAARTLRAALASLPGQLSRLADAVAAQEASHTALSTGVERAHAATQSSLAAALFDGRVLHGEVLARWQDFIGSGQFFRGISPSLARSRELERSDAAAPLMEAVQRNLSVLVHEAVLELHSAALSNLQAEPAGVAALAGIPSAARLPQGIAEEIDGAARQWSLAVETAVSEAAESGRAKTTVLSFGIKGVAAVLQLAVLSSSASEAARTERSIGGTAALTTSLLDSLFGSELRTELSAVAADRLRRSTGQAITASLAPLSALLEETAPAEDAAATLRQASARVKDAL